MAYFEDNESLLGRQRELQRTQDEENLAISQDMKDMAREFVDAMADLGANLNDLGLYHITGGYFVNPEGTYFYHSEESWGPCRPEAVGSMYTPNAGYSILPLYETLRKHMATMLSQQASIKVRKERG
ncbi:MAG: hypothetical protein Q7U75_19755 [Desulfobacterales bacterium]|nr:hypothetical protein [Desulfobacterales bacterium]